MIVTISNRFTAGRVRFSSLRFPPRTTRQPDCYLTLIFQWSYNPLSIWAKPFGSFERILPETEL